MKMQSRLQGEFFAVLRLTLFKNWIPRASDKIDGICLKATQHVKHVACT